MILGQSDISDAGFYYGIQTDVSDPLTGKGRGKGLIFSRWKTRDLANANTAPDGWSESSGHEGDFIGVRRAYDWRAGSYRVRLAPDGKGENEEWFGLWITDLSTNATTWIGSLKFPLEAGEDRAWIEGTSYTTVEIYGQPIRPIDIPEWQVSVHRPLGDDVQSSSGLTGYAPFTGAFLNAEVHYAREKDIVKLGVGGETLQETEAQTVTFE